MKILMASDCYTFQTGGVTNAILSLENGLRREGCQVRVLALSDTHRSWKDGENYYIRSRRFPDYPEHRISFAFHDPLLDELAAWKPDIVHIHTEATMGMMAKNIAGKAHAPVVMTAHTDYEYFMFGRFRGNPAVRAAAKAIGKRVYRQAEKVIVPAEKARSFPHLLPVADKVMVIPNGVQAERYRISVSPQEKSALFRQYGLQDNGYTLVMVTRLSREKNIMEILRYLPALLDRLPEAQLLIVGEGPDRKRLETFCAQNRLTEHVRFTGRIPPDEVYRYYQMGQVFVSASTFELHSMSYLEAMACGLPLVCRDDASLTGVLDNGENGYIYTDRQGFTDAVCCILRDSALRERMGEKALLQAEANSDRRFVQRTLELYRSVLSSWEKPENTVES